MKNKQVQKLKGATELLSLFILSLGLKTAHPSKGVQSA